MSIVFYSHYLLFLFDLQTGIEASRIIRQGGYPHLIIGVTGNSMEDELDDFIGTLENFWYRCAMRCFVQMLCVCSPVDTF